jgi:hypothetical protein
MPENHFGSCCGVENLSVGDIIYVGPRHRLGVFKILGITKVYLDDSKYNYHLITFSEDQTIGNEQVKDQEVVFVVTPETRISVTRKRFL